MSTSRHAETLALPSGNRQRGFSIIIVFLLILMLVGAAGPLLLGTQSDLQVAGYDRGAMVAIYAAEAGVSFARGWLDTQIQGASDWSPVLGSGSAYLCVSRGAAATAPGIAPDPARNPALPVPLATPPPANDVLSASTYPGHYRFCVHNDSADPNYSPAQGSPATGDTSDGNHTLTIESYGYGPDGASSRITVDVVLSAGGAASGEYASALGGPQKQARGEQVSATAKSGGTFGTF